MVEQVKDLDGMKSFVGLFNFYVIMFFNGKEVYQIKKFKCMNNLIWDGGLKEIFIIDWKKVKLGVIIKDDCDIIGDQVIGKYQIKFDDMLECMEQGKEWYNLVGVFIGWVKMLVKWKFVVIQGIVGMGGYIILIGVMCLYFYKVIDFRNFEFFGKLDLYVCVLLFGIEKGCIVIFCNDLNLEWDEVFYVLVYFQCECLIIDVMDVEKMGKDCSLGFVEFFVGDYVVQDENGEYLIYDCKNFWEDGLCFYGKGIVKGNLYFIVVFFFCVNVVDFEEDEEEEDVKFELIDRLVIVGKFCVSFEKIFVNGDVMLILLIMINGRLFVELLKVLVKVCLSLEEFLRCEFGLFIFYLMEVEMFEI